jgi:DNA-binding transcriptional regulator LsrR (DeoR family)
MGRYRQLRHVNDEIVFAIAAKFIQERKSASEIEHWLRGEYPKELARLEHDFGIRLTREVIYPLLHEAIERDFLVLKPPVDLSLAENLAYKYDTGWRSLQVVNVRGPDTSRQVAAASAELVLSLIKKLGQKKQRVHLGLGAGITTLAVSQHLARLLRAEPEYPDLVLHALTSPFPVEYPRSAPVSYFSFFDETKIEAVGLFAAAVVACEDYKNVKSLPGVREAFERAGEIDIVLTSLAKAHHEHGLLNHFLDLDYPPAKKMLAALEAAKWLGDVQFLPYSCTGPISLNRGIRAVTLFELPELVQIAQREDKYVVLAAGPCGQCGEAKTEAIVPLLQREELHVWTHLVTDVVTARELLGDGAGK